MSVSYISDNHFPNHWERNCIFFKFCDYHDMGIEKIQLTSKGYHPTYYLMWLMLTRALPAAAMAQPFKSRWIIPKDELTAKENPEKHQSSHWVTRPLMRPALNVTGFNRKEHLVFPPSIPTPQQWQQQKDLPFQVCSQDQKMGMNQCHPEISIGQIMQCADLTDYTKGSFCKVLVAALNWG